MNTFGKTIFTVLLVAIVAIPFGVHAEEGNITAEESIEKQELKEARQNLKAAKKERKEKRADFSAEQKETKAEIKANKKAFKQKAGNIKEAFANITEEQKESFKTLRSEYQEERKTLKESLKDKDLTLEERESIQAELKTLNEGYTTQLKELVADNEEATEFLEKRDELREKNDVLRAEVKERRIAYREGRDEKVEEYKKVFLDRLATAIPQISDDKLEKVGERIETMIEKTESNERMSEEKKDAFISQLISLKEILEEELEAREIDEEDIDLDLEEILEVE